MLMEEGLPGPLQRLHWRSHSRVYRSAFVMQGRAWVVALLNPSDGELHRQLKGFVALEAIDAIGADQAHQKR